MKKNMLALACLGLTLGLTPTGTARADDGYWSHIKTDWLDGNHTVFGKVIDGLAVVDAVKQADLIKSVKIEADADPALTRTTIGTLRASAGRLLM